MKVSKARFTLPVLISAQFVIMLDTSVVNVALPSMQRDLDLTSTGVAWVVNAYFLAFGGFLLMSGRAVDLFGSRRMFMAGSALFAMATLLAGCSPNEAVLVFARFVQGVAAAMISPAALSLVLSEFQGASRAKAMGAWGAASTAGGALGVGAGGAVTGTAGWSWVFFLTIPISVTALVAAPRLFRGQAKQTKNRHFDVKGASAITGSALAAIYSILSGAEQGWTSPEALGGAGISVGLSAYFILCERKAPDPILPLTLFRSRSVGGGILVGFLGGAVRVSTFVLSALYLQEVLKASPSVAGLAMIPTSVGGFIVSLLLLPRLLRTLGPERTLTVGLVLLAGGHFWLSRVPADIGYSVDVLPGLLVASAGVALSFTPSTMVIASGLAPEQGGLASGLATASSQIGAAIGVAVFTAVMSVGRNDSVEIGFQYAFVSSGTVATAAALIALFFLRSSTLRRELQTLQAEASKSDAKPVGRP